MSLIAYALNKLLRNIRAIERWCHDCMSLHFSYKILTEKYDFLCEETDSTRVASKGDVSNFLSKIFSELFGQRPSGQSVVRSHILGT